MPDSQEEFDRAWAEIVEDLTTPDPEDPAPDATAPDDSAPDRQAPDRPRPEDPAPDRPAPDRPTADDPAPGARAEAAETHDQAPGGSASSSGLEALFQPLRRQRPRPAPKPETEAAADEFIDSWEDEGHFVPPPPPEIPEGTPVERLAWAGVIGGPLVILLITFTGWAPPTFVGLGAGLATLGGFVTLVWHLPEGRSDGWDDGARL